MDTTTPTTPKPAEPAESAESAEAAEPAQTDALDQEPDEELEELKEPEESEERPTGVGAAAAALAGAGLSVIALTGSWVSRVLAERQTLIGQIESVNAPSTEAKINALYGDAWHLTALVNGCFSALALILGMLVLAGPAFGAPGRFNPTWVRAVSWAAFALGALGVLLFGLMYFDVLTPLPKAAG
ncbi:hypothetical protein DEJ50_09950 [Streptomyces venezuelae]|uniref:Uncharacterized protein n=1 Tax=Streptomyces venezuelae TaxID=54571 RepID=A0A5P2D230_STRVZ|nr:hypothetical protein [Streptomyces venezuelae]QES48088.1 hypothetical protein DEJ50_09950 [Streptomyces venezuelae]